MMMVVMIIVVMVTSTILMVVVRMRIVLMVILGFFPDYLDCEDTTLAFAVYHASQANSFPVDVLQVSKSSADEEFLLCFNGKN
jgi:hypothetical protein